MISFQHKGNFKKFNSYTQKLLKTIKMDKLNIYGKMGVEALKANTPKDTGKTANSWYYVIKKNEKRETITITWNNSNTNNNIPIVIFLQYGHATRNGSYIKGTDFINPAIKPVFEEIVDKLWKEVKSI